MSQSFVLLDKFPNIAFIFLFGCLQLVSTCVALYGYVDLKFKE